MKLLHVTIHTDRFEEEKAFYRDIAGLRMIRDQSSPERKMVFMANEAGDTEIEIIGDAAASDAGNDFLSIGFRTEDVEEKHEQLARLGLAPSQISCPKPGVRFFFVKDPAGVRVQFM